MVGRTIGKYRILEQIGRGGMGTVYKAVDETLDRIVAIKMINADNLSAERMQRFRSEAVTLARLNHPRIAAIHELTRDDHDLLMVMEFAAGETLEKLVARTGALPVTESVVFCDQVLDALEHAHSAGIVHRDLKPSNLMVTPSGEVKVMDFGIARIAGSEHLTTDGFMMGTPAYMAPEQVRGSEVDGRMDLYAVAVVLYRLLTNRLPFRADTPIALIQSHLMDQPTPPRELRPDLPAWIEQVLERGLAKAAADRFQTATEFRQALDRGLNGTLGAISAPWLDRTSAETYAIVTPPASRAGARPISTAALAQPPMAVPNAATSATPPSAPPRAETTVTLRTQHLAVAAALLGLLIVGVGVLAYAALRRPGSTDTAGTAAATSASVSHAAASPGAANAPGAGEPASAPAPAATPPVAAPPAAPTDSPVANAASKSSSPARVPATVPASASLAPGVAAAKPPATSRSPAPTAAAPPAVPAGDAAARHAPEPAAEAAAIESFGDIRAILAQGTDATKGREVEALLSLEPGKLVLRSRESGAVLKTLPYRSIAAATYSQSKRPKGSDAPALAPVPENFGGSGFFLGTSKHWLTLQSKSDFLILRLEDKNVRPVTMALETRTGVKTQRPEQK
jgi:hypothetical protein